MDVVKDELSDFESLPEKIAGLVKFLVEDQSDWITGQVIGVDGGLGSLRGI